jgi:hypothetical protein
MDTQPQSPKPGNTTWERMNVATDEAVGAIKGLLREGTVRRIVVRNGAGRTLLDVPVTAGAVGLLLAPAWLVFGAAAALVGGLTIDVERTAAPPPGGNGPGAGI